MDLIGFKLKFDKYVTLQLVNCQFSYTQKHENKVN